MIIIHLRVVVFWFCFCFCFFLFSRFLILRDGILGTRLKWVGNLKKKKKKKKKTVPIDKIWPVLDIESIPNVVNIHVKQCYFCQIFRDEQVGRVGVILWSKVWMSVRCGGIDKQKHLQKSKQKTKQKTKQKKLCTSLPKYDFILDLWSLST